MRGVLLVVLSGTLCSGSYVGAQAVTSGSAAVSGSNAGSASTRGAGGAHQIRDLAAGSVICSLLAGGNAFTGSPNAQPPTRPDADPAHSIQFTQIWTDGHETTVGRDTAPAGQSVMATVKLPFALSDAQIARLADAGWQPRHDLKTGTIAYCIDGSKRARGEAAVRQRGLLCVAGGA